MRFIFLAFLTFALFACSSAPNVASPQTPVSNTQNPPVSNTQNPNERFDYLYSNCFKGSKSACSELVEKYNLDSAEKCDKDTCNDIGFIYAEAERYFESIAYFKKACDSFNDKFACYNLGLKYAKGQGVKQDFFTAKKYYEKGCNLNHASACNNLGVLYDKGQGVKQNLSTAKKYYGKGCDLGSQVACDNYKEYNEMGIH